MAVQLPDAGETVGNTSEPILAPIAGRKQRAWLQSLNVYIPGVVILILLFLCFLWPLIHTMPPPVGGSVLNANLPIGAPGHFLGTDAVGDDIFSRLVYGGRVSFEVGFATQALGLFVGGLLGIFAALQGRWTDATVMRVFDVLIAFPSLVLVIAIADGLGPSEMHVIWALSFFSIPAFGRLARAATLRLNGQTFMVAGTLAGTSTWRKITRHIVPNILPQMVTFSLLGVGVAIILEGALSYLGYGIPPPGASWGNMIAQGSAVISIQPALVLVPSIALVVTVVALNTLGDGLRARWGVR